MKTYASATIANFGPGFDVFGMAIEEPKDEVIARECDEFRIDAEGYDVPSDGRNVALISARALFNLLHEDGGIYLRLKKA